jgi:hypothetical protein
MAVITKTLNSKYHQWNDEQEPEEKTSVLHWIVHKGNSKEYTKLTFNSAYFASRATTSISAPSDLMRRRNRGKTQLRGVN